MAAQQLQRLLKRRFWPTKCAECSNVYFYPLSIKERFCFDVSCSYSQVAKCAIIKLLQRFQHSKSERHNSSSRPVPSTIKTDLQRAFIYACKRMKEGSERVIQSAAGAHDWKMLCRASKGIWLFLRHPLAMILQLRGGAIVIKPHAICTEDNSNVSQPPYCVSYQWVALLQAIFNTFDVR